MSSMRELRIEADLANLVTVAEFVSVCCEQWRIDESNIHKIQLAIDEAVTNIIEHAYNGGDGEIVLRCWIAAHHFYVKLLDRGEGFEQEDVIQPNITGSLAERDVGGLGLYFMRQLMDEVHFESHEGVNTLQMVKHSVAP